MSLVFPKWINAVPAALVVGAGVTTLGVVAGTWYYATPDYTEVGYEPEQPVAFSHALHAGQLGIDCRYCHTEVEESYHSNIPDLSTCMACHTGDVVTNTAYLNVDLWNAHRVNEELVQVRSAYAEEKPIRWRKVHKLPDYAKFNHAVHVNAGVSCLSCHGNIHMQEVVRQVEPLSMGWCLDCHRNPEEHLVAASDNDPDGFRITDLEAVDAQLRSTSQSEIGAMLARQKQLEPPQSCGACHY